MAGTPMPGRQPWSKVSGDQELWTCRALVSGAPVIAVPLSPLFVSGRSWKDAFRAPIDDEGWPAVANRVVALLVGIDRYEAPVRPLRGCGPDVESIAEYLRNVVEPGRLDLLELRDEHATRQAVTDGLRTHLGSAGPDDTALFYYSGHGSRQRVAGPAGPSSAGAAATDAAAGQAGAERLCETLVLYDSRTSGGWDLVDLELGSFVGAVADRGAHVLVVLDCCHSGSGTRSVDDPEVRTRRAPTDPRVRPRETLLLADDAPADDLTLASSPRTVSGWTGIRAPHVLIAACRADETAKETLTPTGPRGVLSAALLTALTRLGPAATYRDLHRYVSSRAEGAVRDQHPQLETTGAADLDRTFLGAASATRRGEHTLTWSDGTGWVIDAGAVHGVPADVTTKPEITVFALDASTKSPTGDGAGRELARATIRRVEPGRTLVDLDGSQLDRAALYRVRISVVPKTPLPVAITGSAGDVGDLPDTVNLNDPAAAEVVIDVGPEMLTVRRRGPGRPVGVPNGPDGLSGLLLHLAAWWQVLNLQNPATAIPAGALGVQLAGGRMLDGVYLVGYSDLADGTAGSKFELTLTNTTDRRLWCGVLDLTDRFGVYADAVPEGAVALAPGERRTIALSSEVTDADWAAGSTRTNDLLRVVVSTAPFDPRPLQLDELGDHSGTGGDRRVKARPAAPSTDWTVIDVPVTTVRPQLGVAVPPPGSPPAPLGAILIEAHPTLTGHAHLADTGTATRGADVPALPTVLQDLADAIGSLDLGGTRDGGALLDTVVLTDVTGAAGVTPDEPLRLRLPSPLDAGEHILPFAWDGEFFVPLGFARPDGDGSVLLLQRLTDPLDGDPLPGDPDERSLGGSIKILLRKLIGPRLGLPYRYPLLRQATVSGGEVQYHDEPAVRDGDSVLVYVHGIIGDTRVMALSSGTTGVLPSPALIGTQYDVVLTFDYENLNTSIRENGRLLGERLAAVGLGPDSGHTVDIVAHSMGGLVSRWYIEYGGGRRVVRQLTTMGTPNGGSPWANVQRFATVALTAGLNGLAGIGWPAVTLASLLAAIERVDVALDEMQPGSPLLADLAGAPDPGVRYSIIVGDHNVPDGAVPDGRWARMLARLSPRRLIGDVANLAFFDAPNDLAVAVASGRALPPGRTPAPVVTEITCDHLSFFTSATGLAALAARAPKTER